VTIFTPILQVLLAGVVIFVLGVIAWRDYKTGKIPDLLSLALLVCGIVALVVYDQPDLRARLIGLVAISGPLLLITLAKPRAIGGGDVKLMAAAGFLLGWKAVLVAFGLGVVLAGVYAVYLLASKKKKRNEHFPFGPALCVGIAVSYFFSGQVIGFLFG
jgi:leader peptidase (prepilin peptidase)/N-methyltransferase